MDEYMEPEGFRLNLNSLIQALRNVTWLLQKQKATLPSFGDWYPAWQASVKDDPIMSWVVKARNRIVKEADLELNSLARLRMTFDWAHEDEKVFSVVPRWTPSDIARHLAAMGLPSGLPEGQCSLTIERRWVDRLLPDVELLEACADAMGKLTEVIHAAHAAGGVSECDLAVRPRECVGPELNFPPNCMWLGEDIRAAHFDLATLDQYLSRHHVVTLTPEGAEEARRRYGVMEVPQGDAIERVPTILDMGKTTLAKDGEIMTTTWLLRGDRVIDMQAPVFFDQAGKMLAMQSLAKRVDMLNADGFCLLGEIWLAPAPSSDRMRSGNYTPARDHPDRTEGVHAFGLTKDGRFASVVAPFSHEGDEIVMGEPGDESEAKVLMMMRPILKVWGLDGQHSLEQAVLLAEKSEQAAEDASGETESGAE